jgi:alpha-glucoside transport system substrate-binding protein
MEERIFRRTRVAGLLAAATLVAVACSSGSSSPSPAASTPASAPPASAGAGESPSASAGGQIGGEVSVIGTWTGSEQDSFMAMVAPFEQSTGVKVKYTGTRDINAVLTTGVASGILPDLAGLPGPGQMADFAKAGALKPLDDVLDVNAYKADTSPGLVALGTVDGKITGVFIKAAVKGLIWYDPNVYKGGAPTSWDDLQAKGKAAAATIGGTAKPWCVGLESGAATGWPGTDWIEDLVLRQSGPDVYDAWVAGKQKWTSPEIKSAFQAFGTVVADDAVFGGSKTVLATAFGDGGNPLFTTPPGCVFHHQASFITDFFVKQGGAKAGDYDFYPFPDINPSYAGAVTGAGDLFGMFNDTPQAKALIAYLVTAPAQQIWVDRGGALSANNKVTKYPDDISQRSAEIITNAKLFRFDGSDAMPAAMGAAFLTAIVDFTKDQSKLDSILTTLDQVQSSAYGG